MISHFIIHSFIYPFNKYILSAFSIFGIMPEIVERKRGKKNDPVCVYMELII